MVLRYLEKIFLWWKFCENFRIKYLTTYLIVPWSFVRKLVVDTSIETDQIALIAESFFGSRFSPRFLGNFCRYFLNEKEMALYEPFTINRNSVSFCSIVFQAICNDQFRVKTRCNCTKSLDGWKKFHFLKDLIWNERAGLCGVQADLYDEGHYISEVIKKLQDKKNWINNN